MPKLPWLFLCIVLTISHSMAGGPSADSLRIALSEAANNDIRLELLVKLAENYRTTDGDSMRLYAEQALASSDSKTSPATFVKVLNLIGIYHFQKASYDSAIYYFERGLPSAQLAEDSTQYAAFLNNIGLCYTYKSEYDKAIDYHLQALAIREATGDPKISSSYNNLGIVYDRMEELEKSEEYQLKALELKRKEGQTLALANSLLNLGILMRKQEKYEAAVAYYEESLAIAEEFGDKKKAANALNNIGSAYVSLRDFKKAGAYFEKSIAIKREIEDLHGLARSLGELAEIRALYGNFSQARALALEAEAIAATIGSKEIEHLTFTNRADVEEMAGNYKVALEYQRKASAIWAEMISEEKNERIAELEVVYETARKESEIKQLSLQHKITEAQLAEERAWFVGSVVCLSMLVVGLMIYATMQGKRRKAEMTLQEHQFDALQKRYMDLLNGPVALELSVDLNNLNEKLVDQVSEREFEAFSLSLEGKTNQEIAERLYLSPNTVKFHLRNVYQKLGVRNRKEAVEYVVSSS